MDISKWDLGGKIIIGSTILALLSFFFKWVDIGLIAQNGFSQGIFFFIIVFIYPALMVLLNKPVSKIAGYVCAVLGIVLGILYISRKTADLFGTSFNAASTGPYVFIIASVLLAVGVWKSQK